MPKANVLQRRKQRKFIIKTNFPTSAERKKPSEREFFATPGWDRPALYLHGTDRQAALSDPQHPHKYLSKGQRKFVRRKLADPSYGVAKKPQGSQLKPLKQTTHPSKYRQKKA